MAAEGNEQKPPSVKLGEHVYTVGEGKVGELRDSSAVRGDVDVLRQRFAEDGYIFLREVVPPEVVAEAYRAILQHLDSQGLIDGNFPLDEAVFKAGHDSDQGRVQGVEDLIQAEVFKAVVEHPNLFRFFGDFFGKPAKTFDYKWLRAVSPNESSGFHMDSVYMDRGSPHLLTCWIPFCEVPWSLGGLAVLRSSQKSEGWERIRKTYGSLDLDRDDVGGTGWFTEDPEEALHFGGEFETAHFRPGDIVFFSMKTLHGSSVNCTNRWRVSCDVRFQPEDEAIDQRWIRNAEGKIEGLESRWVLHRYDKSVFPKTIDDAKKEWGVHWKEAPGCEPEAKRPKL